MAQLQKNIDAPMHLFHSPETIEARHKERNITFSMAK
jgi:hypothetical protein